MLNLFNNIVILSQKNCATIPKDNVTDIAKYED